MRTRHFYHCPLLKQNDSMIPYYLTDRVFGIVSTDPYGIF